MTDLPTGTVTFLFTDIEGSTRLWEQHPQAMAAALARHDAIMRQVIAAEAGVVYKVIGDAFQAVFTTAPAACAAALATQRALTSEAWGVIGAVLVRMALHTCAAVPEDGDYRTGALNRLGRLMGAVHGGQIVLSRSTADLARDTLPPDVTLRDLGERRLRDLRPESIFQLIAPDLPSAFPPLKILDQLPHNLPVPLTPLIGREQEITTICAMLRRADVRLVTLTGPGGMGKTRLALQTAIDVRDDFAHGAYFVNLAPISDPGLVIATIAQALGVQERSDRPLAERLNEYLRGKQLFLVLDNFEQVVEAAPLVGEFLAAALGPKVLITSREPLHLAGEHEYAVPPLALPDPQRLPPLDRLAHYAAMQLFLARAQAVKADFVVTSESAPAIATICQRLDGLPLAIELAAARVKLLPPHALLTRLDQRLKLLTGGARDLPARQQTLRAAIDWSYDLLSPDEQALFRRLGVFVGGCTVEAAEAVGNAEHDLALDVFDGLAALVDKSLLKQAEGAAGEPRFAMLETIRAYALDRLADGQELDTVRRQHLNYYLALVEQAKPELYGAQQRGWLARLRQDYDNLRAALGWAIEQDAAELSLRLVNALDNFWFLAGYISEGVRWATALVAQARVAWPAELRAHALGIVGFMAWQHGDYAAAREPLEESAAIFRRLDDKRDLASTLNMLGRALLFQGEHERARMAFEECTALSQETGDLDRLANSLHGRAYVAMDQADYPAARAFLEQSLTIYQTVANQWGIAQTLNHLGDIARCERDYDRAATLYQESLALFQAQGIEVEFAAVLHNLGYVALAQGNQQHAHARFAESLELHQEQGNQPGMLECLAGFGALLATQGQPKRAAILLGAIAALRAALSAPMWPAERIEYERHLAAVRAALGEGAFQAALDDGRVLTLEQAITEALRVAPESQPAAEAPNQTTQPTGAMSDRLGMLTPRERQVLALIAQGASNRVIADALVIAERTAEIHVSNILGKLGVTSRTQAAAYAVAHGLATPSRE